MAIKLFLSYTNKDKKLANTVHRVLNNSFEGLLEIYLAHAEIKAGDKWKEEIKNALDSCHAIISLITPNSIERPWIFIEWSSFWMADKPFFVLATDDILPRQLVHPMQDAQITTITDEETVKGLFLRLSQLSKDKRAVPYHKANEFVVSIKSALAEQREDNDRVNFEKYRNIHEVLPILDSDKQKIAAYFFNNGDEKEFLRVLRTIRSDSYKTTFSIQALDSGFLKLFGEIVDSLISSEHKQEMALLLLEYGYDDSEELRRLVIDVASKNQAHLRRIVQFLIENGNTDSNIFTLVFEKFTNNNELRKIAEMLIENNRENDFLFWEFVEVLGNRNRAELRNLCLYFIRQEKHKTEVFKKTINLLFERNTKEGQKVLDELKRVDIETYQELAHLGKA